MNLRSDVGKRSSTPIEQEVEPASHGAMTCGNGSTEWDFIEFELDCSWELEWDLFWDCSMECVNGIFLWD